MNPRDYMMQYRESLNRTKQITDHLSQLRELAEDLRDESGRRVSLDEAVANLADAQEQTASELNRLCALRGEILGTIDSVPQKYRSVLYERYVNGKSFEQIAVDLHYCYRQIKRIHRGALAAVGNVLACPLDHVVK